MTDGAHCEVVRQLDEFSAAPLGRVAPGLSLHRPDVTGRDVSLPTGLPGDFTVVVVRFRRGHQKLLDPWLPWLEQMVGAVDAGCTSEDDAEQFEMAGAGGVCVVFREPAGRRSAGHSFRQPGLTVTIARPEALAAAVRRCPGLDEAP